ncbi:MAG: type II toxin-antitoxin system RelE/ParE family toxin [Anaerolineae bacterium]
MNEPYQVLLTRPAEKDIRRLPKSDRQRAQEAILALAEAPRPRGCQKLVQGEGYRIRVGIYRITYGIDDDAREVTVYRVLHRRDAYR